MFRRSLALTRRSQSMRRLAHPLRVESLEGRLLMSADTSSAVAALLSQSSTMTQVKTGLIAQPVSLASVNNAIAQAAARTVSAADSIGPAVAGPYTPSQIRKAYGVNQLAYDGTGQTIAIIDAYDNPTIATDLANFDTKFGVPTANFTKVYTSGSSATSTPPATDPNWALEIALDVEWSHVIAPAAKILLVEAASANGYDLFNAVNYAVSQGANQVSMSFGGGEYSGVSSLDSFFNHPGVSFFASAGDNGAEVEYPAVSPYVTGVGGTTISLDAAGNKISESTWSGSGGGTSLYVARPSYQNGFQASSDRGVPDVSYDANPNSGVYVLDNGSYYQVGGTSAGSPQWAGLAALVNQGRTAQGLAPIGTGLTYGLNSALYSLAGGSSYSNANGDFLDITTGSNGNPVSTGYDTATGLGSPVANILVPDLIAFGATVAAPTVGDSSFETVQTGSYAYNPTGSSWTFSGQAGLSGNNSGFTAGNPNAPQGNQVAFLQNQGVITQTVAGFAAGNYTLSFLAAQRANNGVSNQMIQILVDNAVVGTITPTGTTYATYTSSAFTLTAGSHKITLQGLATSGDNTAFLDGVTIATTTVTPPTTPTVGDSSFETVQTGSYIYDPTGSSWTFTGQAGLSGNNSGFTAGSPNAPQGNQVAFLQNQGVITQTVAGFAAGNYTLSFLAAQRANNGVSNQMIQILVDNAVVGTITPTGTTYATYTSSAFTLTAGSHKITLQGLATSGDNTAFLDGVTIATTTVTPPTTPTVGDSSFETVQTGSYIYDPTGSSWTFSGQAGLSGNNSGFTAGSPNAPQGNQVAFLQNQGVITQTVAGFAAGNYTLSFLASQRANNGGSNQSFAIMVDNTLVVTYNPQGTSYQKFTTPSFTLSAGTHMISFVGMGPKGGDNTVFLDAVSVASA